MENQSTYKLKIGQKIYRASKAIIDFLIAITALIVLLPLFCVIAIAIKIDSPGPVFFVQKRIGKNKKLFSCIKFRSMSIEARHDVAGYEYEDCKSYVTKVGSFIRKYSIDELPQLLNILLFQMSLIGYRPSQTNEKELNDAREKYDIYQIRPGLSGWAQINGRDLLAAMPNQKAEFDNFYLTNFGPLLDIKIFFITIKKVLKNNDIIDGIVDIHQNDLGKEANDKMVTLEASPEIASHEIENINQKEVVQK